MTTCKVSLHLGCMFPFNFVSKFPFYFVLGGWCFFRFIYNSILSSIWLYGFRFTLTSSVGSSTKFWISSSLWTVDRIILFNVDIQFPLQFDVRFHFHSDFKYSLSSDVGYPLNADTGCPIRFPILCCLGIFFLNVFHISELGCPLTSMFKSLLFSNSIFP